MPVGVWVFVLLLRACVDVASIPVSLAWGLFAAEDALAASDRIHFSPVQNNAQELAWCTD